MINGKREIRIGDTVTIAGHKYELLQIENESIAVRCLDLTKKQQRVFSYGVESFRRMVRCYGMELVDN